MQINHVVIVLMEVHSNQHIVYLLRYELPHSLPPVPKCARQM